MLDANGNFVLSPWITGQGTGYNGGMMNPASSGFVQPGGIAGNGQLNWFQNLQNSWNNSSFGSGVNSAVDAAGGWGNVMGGLNSVMQMYAGWKSMGLQEDYLDMRRNQFNKNYEAQRQLIENSLRDQWAGRAANARLDGRDYVSESEFMKQRAIAG